MESRIETLLDAVVNEGTIEGFEPQSRSEAYLLNCVNKTGTENLPSPVSRSDALMYLLAENIANSVDTSDATATAEDIVSGKTAYIGEGKITGTLEPLDLPPCGATDLSWSMAGNWVLPVAPYINTSEVVNFEHMFRGNTYITYAPPYDLSSATNAKGMFYECKMLSTAAILNPNKLVDVTQIFYGCTSLKNISLPSLAHIKVFANMFHSCSSLEHIGPIDCSSGTTMFGICPNCTSLIDIEFKNTYNIKNYKHAFDGCTSLTNVSLIDMRNTNTETYAMFSNCKSLTNLQIKNIGLALALNQSPLSMESLINLIYELRVRSSSFVLTIGTDNINKINDIYVKLIDVTDEMRAEDDLIDDKLPFEICESTDEEALHMVTEYALLKNWSVQ